MADVTSEIRGGAGIIFLIILMAVSNFRYGRNGVGEIRRAARGRKRP